MEKSYFDGGLLQLIGWRIVGVLLSVCTLGLGIPWAVCMLYDWETKHTVINGHRLRFTGTGGQLFGSYIKWWLLTIITLGIYGLWVPIKVKKWITKHSEFADLTVARSLSTGAAAMAAASTAVSIASAVASMPETTITAAPRSEAAVVASRGDTPFWALTAAGLLLCVLGLGCMWFYSMLGIIGVIVGIAVLLVAERS